MNLINISVLIKNEDAPYSYRGKAREHKDLIEYDHLGENLIFDKSIQRITKTNSNSTVIIDFFNKEIIIKSKEKSFNIKIEILKKEISENKYYYLYKLDNKKIEFVLKKEV